MPFVLALEEATGYSKHSNNTKSDKNTASQRNEKRHVNVIANASGF